MTPIPIEYVVLDHAHCAPPHVRRDGHERRYLICSPAILDEVLGPRRDGKAAARIVGACGYVPAADRIRYFWPADMPAPWPARTA